ncbi:hypothetical protein PoB_001292000 [Plakobranchus ocellatus]|uniref:Uncharacterized protein n=1 Tax=Plakobranchus ocellatus TaxID=259542 RepID=A0AAV3YUB1_9GAST|nr:hypothetical protein PoB_001292000 [Plakobranchus ocellatus]
MYKREIKQMVLKLCSGCIDREAGVHAAYMHPKSLDDAIRDILQFQFNHAAVYGSRGKKGVSDVTVRAVRSPHDYGGGWPRVVMTTVAESIHLNGVKLSLPIDPAGIPQTG